MNAWHIDKFLKVECLQVKICTLREHTLAIVSNFAIILYIIQCQSYFEIIHAIKQIQIQWITKGWIHDILINSWRISSGQNTHFVKTHRSWFSTVVLTVHFTWRYNIISYLQPINQFMSWQLGVKSKCYEHNSCVRLDMALPWGHLELRKSSHHIHHMPNMTVMVAPRNMFGWDSYLDLKVICTAHIEG